MKNKPYMKLQNHRPQPKPLSFGETELTDQELDLVEGGFHSGSLLDEKKQAPGIIGVLKMPDNIMLNFSKK